MKTLISLTITLLFFAASFAQNQGINYKAVVKDDDGNLVTNQTIDVRFTIFEGATGVYQEYHTVTTDSNGLIILNIGEGDADGISFSIIDWSNSNHRIATDIDIEQDGTFVFLGDTAFKTVPYALYTANAASKIDDLEDGIFDGSSLFLGAGAGANDDGNNINVGVGNNALFNNITGFQNTSVGYGSGFSNTSGETNSFFGYQAGYDNTTGNSNSFFGRISGFNNTTGSFNSFFGFNAGFSNTTGYSNVAVGYEALRKSQTGRDNVAIGFQAGDSFTNNFENHNRCVFIGYRAGYNSEGDNKLYIHNSGSFTPLIYGEFDNDILGFNGDVAIGHQVPQAPLHIKKDGTANTQTIVAVLESETSDRPTLLFSETANADVNAGMSLEYNGTGSGDANKIVFNAIGGLPLLELLNSGNLKLLDGDLIVDGSTTLRNTVSTEPDLVLGGNSAAADNGFIISDPQFTSSDIVIQSNDAVSIRLDNDNNETGQFQIINGNSSVVFEVLESGIIKQNGTTIHSSDRRLKKDIETLPYGLNEILQLQPKTYNWKNREQTHKSLGLIAQEVQPIIKEIVVVKDDEMKTLGISYIELIPVLINAIKDQAQEIETLKNAHENRIKRLEEYFATLEN